MHRILMSHTKAPMCAHLHICKALEQEAGGVRTYRASTWLASGWCVRRPMQGTQDVTAGCRKMCGVKWCVQENVWRCGKTAGKRKGGDACERAGIVPCVVSKQRAAARGISGGVRAGKQEERRHGRATRTKRARQEGARCRWHASAPRRKHGLLHEKCRGVRRLAHGWARPAQMHEWQCQEVLTVRSEQASRRDGDTGEQPKGHGGEEWDAGGMHWHPGASMDYCMGMSAGTCSERKRKDAALCNREGGGVQGQVADVHSRIWDVHVAPAVRVNWVQPSTQRSRKAGTIKRSNYWETEMEGFLGIDNSKSQVEKRGDSERAGAAVASSGGGGVKRTDVTHVKGLMHDEDAATLMGGQNSAHREYLKEAGKNTILFWNTVICNRKMAWERPK
ncbi:hypothetical protein DFH08DRAFT_801169 [Mycena albidolilacea]|uniref:Uncharacterized protein n=1 Tax=Mycena albidolilacea TaxID=1033008 RepID=A0AAD7AHZ8_9AGAR|nr:hypothetical protein DFH08DRAFT_801169 [Mycena albidolilacea]